MPNGETQFVLDNHVLAEGSVRTLCGEEVPYNSPWTLDMPDKVCPDCSARAEESGLPTPEGRRWTKAKATKEK